MGKMNTAMCSFLSAKDRFADLFNGAVFGGEQVIHPNDLQAASEQYSTSDEDSSQRFRDIKMYLNNGEALRILAVENQNKVDYTLPYRCMEYDVLEYGRQLKELRQANRQNRRLHTPAEWLSGISRDDRLVPVYTLCLYHGEEPWDGPLSLRDMMDLKNDKENLSRHFADYPMRLFCINEHTNFTDFHTELKEVFTVLSHRKNKEKLYSVMTRDAAFRKLSKEAVQVLSVLLNAPKLWEERKSFMNANQNEEEYDMCQAMRELFEDARSEGESRGLSQGLSQGLELAQALLANNRLEDLVKAVTDSTFRDKLLEEYQLK